MKYSGFNVPHLAIAVSLLLPGSGICSQETRLKELNDRAVQFYREGKLDQAAQAEMEAIHSAEAEYGPDDLRVGLALSNLCSIDKESGHFADAVDVCKRCLAILEKNLSATDPKVATALNELGLAYAGMQRYPDAEPLYRRALRIEESSSGPSSSRAAAVLINIANAYKNEGRLGEAEPNYRRAIEIDETTLGNEDPAVASASNDLAGLLKEQGRYAEAEQLYIRSLTIREKRNGPNSRSVAVLANNLGALYDDQGKLRDAEALYRRALGIDEKALGSEHPDLAIDLNNLASLYQEEGRYGDAEPLFQRVLAIRKKALGPDHPAVGMSLSNLADIYKAQGKFGEAETLLRRALAIEEGSLGPHSLDVATVANNLAGLYRSRGRFQEAKPLFRRALAIDQQVLGEKNPRVASDLNNLALFYADQGLLNEAEPLYLQSLSIDERIFGAEHEKVATVLNNLGSIYNAQGKSAESEKAYLRALRIQEKVFGPDHPEIENTTTNLAVLYDSQGKYAQAEPYFQRALGILFREFQYHFSYMTERDRLNFLNSVATRFPAYFSFVYRNRYKDPKLIGSMYDLLLWEKGFVATSVAQLRREIEHSGDAEAIAMLSRFSEKQTQIAALLGGDITTRAKTQPEIERLKTEADEIEKELVLRSSAFRQHRKLERTTWEQVRDRLNPGEAAVEIARFRYFENGWQDRSLYAALVIRRNTRGQPQFIDLGEDTPLNTASRTSLENAVATRGLFAESAAAVPGRQLYKRLWRPLEASLAGAKRIYVSPDGVLNQIPLGLIPLPGGRLLMERYDLRLVLSTKDILRDFTKPGTSAALLIGDPDFDLNAQEKKIALAKLGVTPSDAATNSQAASAGNIQFSASNQAPLPRLPGTGEEVNATAELMKARGWQVTAYTRDLALKTALERSTGQRVLHLATHGFFKTDQQHVPNRDSSEMEDPMLRSGLYLAGANRTLAGTEIIGHDNGVLTAMEAENLNLAGTELVVLSACDTGRGEVQDGEGVFGLRRALQEAGAQAVLMSLWSVPDNETQELMRQFYTRWLRGVEMHDALKQAQMAVRAQVRKEHGGRDLPYYWGAFVLAGR